MQRLPEIAVSDTHAMIWWITNEQRMLGRRARTFFERVDAGEAVVCIPSIVLVELSEALGYGELHLEESFATFVDRLSNTPSRYQVADLTAEIVVRSTELFSIPERGDRLIAATAAVLEYPLITRDGEISAAIREDHIWD